MSRQRHGHQAAHVTDPTTIELMRRHAAQCEECRRQLQQVAHFDAELDIVSRALSGPSLPAATLAVAADIRTRPSFQIHRLVLGAAAAGVLVLAVAVGGLIASLVDRAPTNIGASPAPEPTSPFRHSRQQFLLLVGECVRDEGFASVRVDVRESKIDFADRSDVLTGGRDAIRACVVRVDPARHEPPPPRTERQLMALYEFRVAQARCLDALGFYVQDPPTLEHFLLEGAEWEPASRTSAPLDQQLKCEYIPQRPGFLDW